MKRKTTTRKTTSKEELVAIQKTHGDNIRILQKQLDNLANKTINSINSLREDILEIKTNMLELNHKYLEHQNSRIPINNGEVKFMTRDEALLEIWDKLYQNSLTQEHIMQTIQKVDDLLIRYNNMQNIFRRYKKMFILIGIVVLLYFGYITYLIAYTELPQYVIKMYNIVKDIL